MEKFCALKMAAKIGMKIELNQMPVYTKLNYENSGDGIILSNRGEHFISNDSGKSWDKKNVGQPVILNDIKQLNSGNFIIACNGGNIYKSKMASK